MPLLSKPEPQFCEWLLDVLDQNRSPKNAFWIDRTEKVFAVRWTHGSSKAWTPECGDLFKLWRNECSRSRGKQGATFAHKDIKTNFRMNLRSERFSELRDRRITKGVDAVRVYKVVKMPTTSPKTDLRIAGRVLRIDYSSRKERRGQLRSPNYNNECLDGIFSNQLFKLRYPQPRKQSYTSMSL